MGDKTLPPMPKLRPRPGLTLLSDEVPPPPLKKRKIPIPEEPKKPQGTIEIIEEDAKTSRLLTKSECGRGGGRKRNSGSTIHSIPKFSQVVPKGGKISEVQKVLQSRLLSKQLSRQSQSCPTTPTNLSPTKISKPNVQIQKDFPATFMLQSIHEKASKAQIQTPKPLPIINQTRKRNRKPDKSSICHVVPESTIQQEEEIDSPLKQILDEAKPEVTITPTQKTTSILSPEDYRKQGMPSGYIFWPTANVFVHPSMLQSHWEEYAKRNTQTGTDSLESLSGVMKVRPQKPDLDVATQKSTKIDTKKISEVSICKFKFTGGAKPSLEEKKMMSVDSGGHFRYYSGSESSDSIRSLKGIEILSKETMAQNASHIVTDRFTSLTADKLNKKVTNSPNKKKHDYAADHHFRPIKPKPMQ